MHSIAQRLLILFIFVGLKLSFEDNDNVITILSVSNLQSMYTELNITLTRSR